MKPEETGSPDGSGVRVPLGSPSEARESLDRATGRVGPAGTRRLEGPSPPSSLDNRTILARGAKPLGGVPPPASPGRGAGPHPARRQPPRLPGSPGVGNADVGLAGSPRGTARPLRRASDRGGGAWCAGRPCNGHRPRRAHETDPSPRPPRGGKGTAVPPTGWLPAAARSPGDRPRPPARRAPQEPPAAGRPRVRPGAPPTSAGSFPLRGAPAGLTTRHNRHMTTTQTNQDKTVRLVAALLGMTEAETRKALAR